MIRPNALPWDRRGYPHAQVHLPPLTAQEALLVINLLERLVRALWKAHGGAMADYLGCHDPDDALPTEPTSAAGVDADDGCADDILF